jgi:hypothetical protein
LGLLPMYIGADWETVNSINGTYTAIDVPNLGSSKYSMMYTDVLWLTVVLNDLGCYQAL